MFIVQIDMEVVLLVHMSVLWNVGTMTCQYFELSVLWPVSTSTVGTLICRYFDCQYFERSQKKLLYIFNKLINVWFIHVWYFSFMFVSLGQRRVDTLFPGYRCSFSFCIFNFGLYFLLRLLPSAKIMCTL
jgi:hypothetical protein